MVESESATRSSSKGFGIRYLQPTHVHVKNHKAARQDGSVKTPANTRATGSTKNVGRTSDGRDGLSNRIEVLTLRFVGVDRQLPKMSVGDIHLAPATACCRFPRAGRCSECAFGGWSGRARAGLFRSDSHAPFELPARLSRDHQDPTGTRCKHQ